MGHSSSKVQPKQPSTSDQAKIRGNRQLHSLDQQIQQAQKQSFVFKNQAKQYVLDNNDALALSFIKLNKFTDQQIKSLSSQYLVLQKQMNNLDYANQTKSSMSAIQNFQNQFNSDEYMKKVDEINSICQLSCENQQQIDNYCKMNQEVNSIASDEDLNMLKAEIAETKQLSVQQNDNINNQKIIIQ